jgi:predicted permease
MANLTQDLRYAIRSLLKTPVLLVAATLSLGLGIGGNATLFTAVNGLLLKPLPVVDPSRTVAVYTGDYSGPPYSSSSYPDYVAFRERLTTLDRLAAMSLHPSSLTTPSGTDRVFLGMVSADFFRMAQPLAFGRGFSAAEDQPPAGEPVIVLSHGLWLRHFGGDSTVIGRSVVLGGHPFTVIGVGQTGFTGLIRGFGQDAWVPLTVSPLLTPGSDDLTHRGNRSLLMYGHLAPGATLERAQTQAAAVAAELYREFPDNWRNLQGQGRPISVLPESRVRILFPAFRNPILGVSGLLFLVVGAVLLIACANVANLLLARAASRRREIAVRLALGAGRRRLIQLFLSESLLIALAGGGLGLLLAGWAADLLAAFQPPLPVPIALDFRPDARVIAFTVAVSLLAGIGLGIGPALQWTRPNLVPALKDNAGASPRSRLRNGFIVAQVVLSVVLLVVAALFLRSLRNATAIDPGFHATSGLLVTTDLGLNGYDATRAQTFQASLVERVRALPGVETAALVTTLPLSIGGNRQGLSIEGYTPAQGEDMEVHQSSVGPGYFETLEVSLARGRGFGEADRAGAPGVAIVNESFARRYWPGQEALGRHISVAGPEDPGLEVVGIARDGKYQTLGEDPTPFFYLPLLQFPERRTTLVIRTAADPAELGPRLRDVVRELDPNLPLESVTTLSDHVAFSLLPARAGGMVLGSLGVLGLLLACLGIYGVVAYGVSQRRREIGIRMAMGANSGRVVRLAVRDGLRLVAVGLLAGLALAAIGARFLGGLLYGLAPLDPGAFLIAPMLFLLVAFAACWLPARRAAAVNPMIVLRSD